MSKSQKKKYPSFNRQSASIRLFLLLFSLFFLFFIGCTKVAAPSKSNSNSNSNSITITDAKIVGSPVAIASGETITMARACEILVVEPSSVTVSDSVAGSRLSASTWIYYGESDTLSAGKYTSSKTLTIVDASDNVVDDAFVINVEFPACDTSAASAAFGGRNGADADNAYWIDSADKLLLFSHLVAHDNDTYGNKSYKLTTDIDLGLADQPWSQAAGGEGFSPIGQIDDMNNTNSFSGTFDCDNKVVSNLYINIPDGRNLGLFGRISGATIKNCALINVDVAGYEGIGGLVGTMVTNSIVENSYTTGSLSGVRNVVGGLVGGSSDSTVRNSYSTASVRAAGTTAGGLVGWHNEGSAIINSYATGSATGYSQIGGLVGRSSPTATVTNSYSTASVTGDGYVGGLVGSTTTVTTSYWDTVTSGRPTSAGGRGRTTAQMQVSGPIPTGSDAIYESWDSSIWSFAVGRYPVLKTVACANRQLDPSATTCTDLNNSQPALSITIADAKIAGNPATIVSGETITMADACEILTLSSANVRVSGVAAGSRLSTSTWSYYGASDTLSAGKYTSSKTLTIVDASGNVVDNAFVINVEFPPCDASAASIAFGGGNGDAAASAYRIDSADKLVLVSHLVENDNPTYASKFYELTANIDLSLADHPWSESAGGAGFPPIGKDFSSSFSGTFDCKNNTIFNLYINRGNTDYIALFGRTSGSTIKNCALNNVKVTGNDYVGGLVGYSSNNATVENSYATASVTGDGYVGGLVGYNYTSTVENSYATASVTGDDYVGGLIGVSTNATVENSYATGSVIGTNRVGGLVGRNSGNASPITNTYAIGSVTGNTEVGGLIGNLDGTDAVQNSYWNTETTGQAASRAGRGRTTAQMQIAEPTTGNNTVYESWDSSIWSYADGRYPVLRTVACANRQLDPSDTSCTDLNNAQPALSITITDAKIAGNPATIVSGGTITMAGPCEILALSSANVTVSSDVAGSRLGTSTWIYYAASDTLSAGKYTISKTLTIVDASDNVVDNAFVINVEFPPCDASAASIAFGGRTGTDAASAYQIDSADKLVLVSHLVENDNPTYASKFYELTADIDLGIAGMPWSQAVGGEGFIAIGKYDLANNHPLAFKGTFDCNNNTISNLYVNRPSTIGVGLFGWTDGSTIKNCALNNVNLTGADSVGGLAGGNWNSSTVENSYATGSVSGYTNVGGLVGRNDINSTVRNSYATASVRATGTTGGGDRIGGLIGNNSSYSTVENSYATGSVTGTNRVGGLVGRNSGNASPITNTYAIGSVTGTTEVGGLIGNIQGTHDVENSYWNTETTGQAASRAGRGRTTAQMQVAEPTTGTDAVYESWSRSIWSLADGRYPVLRNVACANRQLDPSDTSCTGLNNSVPITDWLTASSFNAYFTEASFGGQTATTLRFDGTYISISGGITNLPSGAIVLTSQLPAGYTLSGADALTDPDGDLIAEIMNGDAGSITITEDSYPDNTATYPVKITLAAAYVSVVDKSHISATDFAGNSIGQEFIDITGTVITISGILNTDGTDGMGSVAITPSGYTITPSGPFSFKNPAGMAFATQTNTFRVTDSAGLVIQHSIVVQFSSPFGNGRTGETAASAYQIESAAKLELFSRLVETSNATYGDKFYELTADIDLGIASDTWSESASGTDGAGFPSIGKENTNFAGTFDCKDNVISNLYINIPTTTNVGFFGYVVGATIKNCTLNGVNIRGYDNVGGLVGTMVATSTVENSYATGSVIGNNRAGGLVGRNDINSTVRNSYATGTITGDNWVGGLVGLNTANSTVRDSYATASVTGSSWVGGLVGGNSNSSTVENSHATGSVRGYSKVGGLVGLNINSSVRNSYATASVNGNNTNIGGLVGDNYNYSTVADSYATGSVTGTRGNVGGLVGINNRRSIVRGSYATGSVRGGNSNPTGGLVGLNWDSRIENTYATGSVSRASGDVGGLVGENALYSRGIIKNSYATGFVSGDIWDWATGLGWVGGLVGYGRRYTIVENSYWDVTTGWPSPYGQATPRTTAQMQVAAPVETGDDAVYVGWDTTVWSYATSRYPVLINVACPNRQIMPTASCGTSLP